MLKTKKEQRRFSGKTFYAYTQHGTKALALSRAKGLRSIGYNVRIVKVNMMGQGGYLLYTSGTKRSK